MEEEKKQAKQLRKSNFERKIEEKKFKTYNEILIESYLEFKDKCLRFGIDDVDEIIKLFEVWTRTCS